VADVVLAVQGRSDLKVFSPLAEVDALALAEVIAASASLHGPRAARKIRDAANSDRDAEETDAPEPDESMRVTVQVLLDQDELESVRTACGTEGALVERPTAKRLCAEIAAATLAGL
jgi:hypothetical protein